VGSQGGHRVIGAGKGPLSVEAVFGQNFELPADLGLGIEGSYTWTGSPFRSDFHSASPQFGSVKAGDSLPYVPEHQGSASLSLVTPATSIELALAAKGPMRDLPGQGDIDEGLLVPAHANLDLAVDLQILPNLALYATVNNLANNSYIVSRRPYGVRGARPIHAMFGVKLSAQKKGPGLVGLIREKVDRSKGL